jgi:hypothetical protein
MPRGLRRHPGNARIDRPVWPDRGRVVAIGSLPRAGRRAWLLAALLAAMLLPHPTYGQGADAGRTTLYASVPGLADQLPAAPDGTVAVVGTALSPDGASLVAVVRNATDEAVSGVRVMSGVVDLSPIPAAPATAVATPATASGVPTAPLVIPPGGVALARVPLDPTATGGTGAALSVTTSADDAERMDLAIPYAVVADGALAGSVTAVAVDAALDPEVVAVCVGPDGTVAGGAWAALQPRRIDQYRTIPLRLPLPAGCGDVLAAATAHR